jgi:hypothetical protein
VAWQEAEVSRIERRLPNASEDVAKLFLSVDGAMIPLVGGEWAEVKTLVLGEVPAPAQEKVKGDVQTKRHSYFSRLTDAQTFQRQTLVETHKRGVENAESVVAVTDGAEWIQKFINHHRHDALRILDFPHAAERLNAIAQIIWGEASEKATAWFKEQRHRLKQEGPEPVLETIRLLIAGHEASSDLVSHLRYLEKRVEHMRYPQFLAAGWPIGDGAVESANKLVVEARLKGSGMHWARHNVDPMLALRNIVCNDRWDQAWSQITRMRRYQAHLQQKQRRRQRQLDNVLPPNPTPQALSKRQKRARPDSAPKKTLAASP